MELKYLGFAQNKLTREQKFAKAQDIYERAVQATSKDSVLAANIAVKVLRYYKNQKRASQGVFDKTPCNHMPRYMERMTIEQEKLPSFWGGIFANSAITLPPSPCICMHSKHLMRILRHRHLTNPKPFKIWPNRSFFVASLLSPQSFTSAPGNLLKPEGFENLQRTVCVSRLRL